MIRFLFLIFAVACQKSPQTMETVVKEHSLDDKHEELPKHVSLAQEILKDIGLKVEAAQKIALHTVLTLPGEIVADPNKSAQVSSPIAGKIESLNFSEGSSVKKGDILATVSVPELGKLRSAEITTLEKAKAARANANRLNDLLQKQLASKQAYLDAEAEAQALEAEAKAAVEQSRTVGISNASALALRAPLSGVIVERNAVMGQSITSNQNIASISDLSEVWFFARVFEKDLALLHLQAKAEIELNAYPKQRFAAVVEYISKQIDPIARTFTARLRLKNKDNVLRLGLFGNAYVESNEGSTEPVLAVPRSAVIEIQNKPSVFVEQKDGDFQFHEVGIGRTAPGFIEITSGLKEGERVVIEGAFTLKSILLKDQFGEED